MRQWRRWGVKLPGNDSLTDNNILKGVGLGGMVKTFKLLWTYRHARKCESCCYTLAKMARRQDASTFFASTWMLFFRYIGST
jgi:hypothetical protein